MFDLGMSELLVIGVVGLIVIGPKDLPGLFRTLGRFTAKMRTMAREFSRAMEAAADETGMKDVAKDLKNVTSAKSMGLDAVKDAASKFEKWDPMKNAARPTSSTPATDPAPVVPSAPATADPARGPATQALAEAQAARKAVVKDAVAKLAKTPAVAAPEAAAAAPVKKPRAPRKPKTDSTPKADA